MTVTADRSQDRAPGGHFDGGDAPAVERQQPVTVSAAENPGVVGEHRDGVLGDRNRVVVTGFLICDVEVITRRQPNSEHHLRHPQTPLSSTSPTRFSTITGISRAVCCW